MFGKRSMRLGLEEYRRTEGAVLMDVREREAFLAGHIPGAANLPLSELDSIGLDKGTPLFLYCLRGMRSRQAQRRLRKMGYIRAKSIGGIAGYEGPLETH